MADRNNPTPQGTVVRAVERRPRYDIAAVAIVALVLMTALLVFTFVRDAGATEHHPAMDSSSSGELNPTLTQAVINSDGAWIVGTFPAGSGRWLLETYDPTDYDNQTLTASVLVDATLADQTVDELLPIHDPGCAQLDIRREGSDTSIGGDLHQEACVVAPVAPPAPTPAPVVVEQAGGETATNSGPAPAVAVSSGQEVAGNAAGLTAPAPLVPAPLAEVSTVAVSRQLAFTGANAWTPLALLLGVALLIVGAPCTIVTRRHLKGQKP